MSLSQSPPPSPTPAAPGQLPTWYPAWARDLADSYFSGTTCVFVLHGNVHDLVRCPGGEEDTYCSLGDFLATQVFGKWDLVVGHELSRGLRPQAGASPERLRAMMQQLTAQWGDPAAWPREPDKVLAMLDILIERMLVAEPAQRKSVAVLFEYAQYLVAAGDLDTVTRGSAARLVRFLSWAENPHVKRSNIAFCLVADRLAEVNERLVQNAYVSAIEIPLPDRAERLRFLQSAVKGQDLKTLADFSLDELADMSAGLSLVNLNVLVSQAVRAQRRLDAQRFRQLKKTMIERQCRDLVEFLEPSHNLDLLVGYTEAKKRLQEDAAWIARGQAETAPMGYLVCGPVGTGKTFLAECYAGSIGIPCLVMKNFRSSTWARPRPICSRC